MVGLGVRVSSSTVMTHSTRVPPKRMPWRRRACGINPRGAAVAGRIYHRRGWPALSVGLLGLQAEDDDGNKASQKTETKSESKDDDKEWLNPGDPHWISAVNKGSSLEALRKYYKIGKANAEKYIKEVTANQN